MAHIKDMNRIVEKWKRVAATAGEEYRQGIQSPRADWATETKAAEPRYEAGIAASVGRKSFGKGVSKAGTSKWQEMSLKKGPTRWTEGINVSGDAYATGFAPYAQVISSTTLPPRGPKGDPANIQRVAKIAKVLHDEKVKRMGT